MKEKITAIITAAVMMTPFIPARADDGIMRVRLDPSNSSPFNNGEFEGWGTSMGWWGNRLGHSDKMSQQAAEDLYSEDGLGLDIVRYNVGGGDNPTHNHINRSDSKLPCFAVPQYEGNEYQAAGDVNADVTNLKRDENDDVVYDWDWNADHDQVNVLTRIKAVNPDVHIEGYTNSPPWFMTNSQCSSGGDDTAENLDPSNYDAFADFLVGVTKHMDEIGLHFDSYSPMNEPNPKSNYWRALSPKQEGNLVAQGANQSGLIKALKDAYTAAGIDTLVAGPDETDLGYTISSYNALTDEAKEALDRIDTHTYGGSDRAGVKAMAENAGKNLWMSEVDGGWNGFGLADRIIADLNGLQASAWIWIMWDIVDFHKDSNFVDPTTGNKTEENASLNPASSMWGVGMGNHDTETVEWANKYYAYGQFTKYINPGDTLIASSSRTLAAYNKNTGDIKIVVTNSGGGDVPYEFDLSAFKTVGSEVKEIRSNNLTGDAAEHWKEITGEAKLNGKKLTAAAKAGTITTYIIKRSEGGIKTVGEYFADEYTADENGLSYSYTLPEAVKGNTAYFAVYDGSGALKYVSVDKTSDTVSGDFSGCTYKLFVWDDMKPVTYEYNDPGDDMDAPMDYAVLNGGDGELLIGGTTAMRLDTNIEGKAVWSVDNSDVADVDKNGVLTIKKSGTVTVTADIDGFTASKTVTIPLTISGGRPELSVGELVQLSCNVAEGYTGEVKWAVDNTGIASIDENGLLTVKKSGAVTVTVTVAGESVSKTFKIPEYTLSGTPSWSDASNAPKDSDDYRKAADGNLATYFDGNQNGYVMYDYGTPYKINKVRLAARPGHDGRTVGGKVQGSNDAINWTDLYTVTEAIPANQYTDVTEFANDNAYRYYRYTNPSEMTNIAEFVIDGERSDNVPEGDPTVKDIAAFTDDFEKPETVNIFNGELKGFENGNIIYACGLERFGNVFIPANSTAVSELDEAIDIKANQLFRMKFNMFSGWEDGGQDNTFAIKDADGNDVISFKINVGSSSLTEFNVGGVNVLDGTPNIQCKSNTSGRTSANGWGHASQPYRNNMGLNRTVEILIEGAGKVSAVFGGGTGDVSVSGILNSPINIKSLELTGACNTAIDRVVSYDNFDTDVITYKDNFIAPTPTPVPTPTAVPTDPPELPEDGTLISLNFDNSDLTSGSTYGKASGAPLFVEVDGRKAAQFTNTAATAIKLTDANGNGILAGQNEATVSFSFKPTDSSKASWWFFTAPNDNGQEYQQEHYIGALSNTQLSIERYNGGGSRATANTGAIKINEWNNVIISLGEDKTDLYINGTLVSSVASSFKLTDILGNDPVAYIGRANWGTGEYATGYIDDFVIKTGALRSALDDIDLGDLSAVTQNLTLPTDGGITWTSSDDTVIDNTGKVTRGDDTKTVTLTASVTENGIPFTKTFEVTVKGYLAAADSFTAYAEGKTIYYTSDYGENEKYGLSVTISGGDSLSVNQIDNQGSGKFDGLANGTYKISYTLNSTPAKMVTKTVIVKDEITPAAYLFAHFMNTEGDADDEQIYFSVSRDGTNWTTLNNKQPVLTSNVGEKGVRDPYILRGEDGKFFVIATDLSIYNLGLTQGGNKWGYSQTNGSKNIVVWESSDLVNWSEANLVKVAVDNAGCTWAPEAVYDPEKGQYMVFWASKVSDDNYSKQRMYRSYTSDFKTFSEPEIYIETDASNIDTTIVSDKGVYYRFTKNESRSSVTMMKANFLDGPWTDVKTYTINGVAGNTVTGYEGPAVYKNIGGGWTMLLDYYSKSQGYKPFTTDDISIGSFTSAGDFKFDGTYRHGTVMPITQAEYDALMEKYK